MARPGERLLPIVSALLLLLAFPPARLLLPSFLGLVPLAVWLARLPPGREGRRAAVRGGALFGLVFFGLLFYWILVALVWFTWLAVPAYLASLGLLAGVGALVGYTSHRLLHDARLPIWAALPLAWTFGEWFRAHWPQELAFPWLGLGTSLATFPELAGAAELVGARGLTFWLALVSGIVAHLIVTGGPSAPMGLAAPTPPPGGRRSRAAAPWIALLLVVGIPSAWGLWRAGTLELRRTGSVAVVQPNIPQEIKIDPEVVMDSTWASLERLLPGLDPGGSDLVVSPEVTMADVVEARPDLQRRVRSWAQRLGAPILFGAYGFEMEGADDPVFFNSALLMLPGGLARYRYDKRHLVPVVERVPLLPDSWFGEARYFGGLGRGEGWPLAVTGGVAYGVLVCYESSYPGASRSFRRAGADVLVNITNDGWYGRDPWYARTTALWQHPAHMVMRAIENRVGVVRAANTGISMFVDPVGRIEGEIDLFRAGVESREVLTTDVVTFYTRFGDLVGNGSAALCIIALVWTGWRGRRREETA